MPTPSLPTETLTFADIDSAVGRLGTGPLEERGLVEHVHPLFSQVLSRPEIYLANHSLGRPLDRSVTDVARFASLWQERMDEAWTPWLAELHAFRARIAALLGLSRPDAVVPKPGAGQGLRAVLNALPAPKDGRMHHLVATRAEFDSIDFILKTYQMKGRARITWVPTRDGLVDQQEIIEAIDSTVDLVVTSHVVFATGQLLDRADQIVAAAHRAGSLCLLDMYHSAGVVPLSMESLGADFAIGGSYKYLRGGPGAGWLAIHPRHLSANQPELRTLDTGWFAKKDTFGFARDEQPMLAPGGDAWMECTPFVLGAYQAAAGIHLLQALGVDRLREHSTRAQAHLADRLIAHSVPTRLIEPRGAFLLIPSRDASSLSNALKESGLNSDARGSHVRLCPDILNTGDELDRAAAIVASVKKATGL